MEFERDGMLYHKTTINLPKEVYDDLARQAKVLGVNFNAMLLMTLNQIKEQKDALDILNKVIDTINYQEKYQFIKTKDKKED